MKRSSNLKNYLLYGLIFSLLIVSSCKEEDSEIEPKVTPEDEEEEPIPGDSEIAKIIESLKFEEAVIKEGDPPAGTMQADLKMDRETIQLAEGIKNRIRLLLPEDFDDDVCGVYVKVEGSDNYFEVSSIVSDSDSLAIFYIGFDPGELTLPLNFNIEIIPHNCLGVPIDRFEKKVMIAADDECTPHSPVAKWYWVSTMINGDLAYAPGFTINSATGSTNGCCLEGYSIDCIANGIPESEWKSLDYTSYVMYDLEYLVFLQDGSFNGALLESKQNIDYSASDFCSGVAAYNGGTSENIFWGEYTYNSSDKTLDFTEVEVRETEIYLEEIDMIVIDYDVCFLSVESTYEMIGCNFLLQKSGVEGQVIERLYERFTGGWEWFD